MFVTLNWPCASTLPVPAETFTDLKHHLLEGFPSEDQARQYWEDIPTLLILLEPEDGPEQLEQALDNVQRQIQFVLDYPEFVVPITGDYLLALGIFSDEGAGIYLLVHNQCPIAQELTDE
ncbi:hypothetical protein GCM10009104_23640 [Marinobacterium maritimum]|uniref:Uncharacterized protein n=1 Tax=Marinobacterium maritimum TaxID=500162 RepID=A0ABN1I7J7_9GAMM